MSERRRYFRVLARLPVRHRPLEPGEFASLKRDIETPRPDPESLEPALASWLVRIEEKLEQVLGLLGDAGAAPAEPVDVEISGGGLRFGAKLPDEQEGDDVLVELTLPGSPPRPIRAIGRVVARTNEDSGHDEVAVSFRVIDERDREAIIRFAHEVERVQLRSRAARERDA